MSGGAGIKVTVELKWFLVKYTGRRLVANPVSAKSFSLEGWMDGARNLRGDLLRIEVEPIITDSEYRAELKSLDIEKGSQLDCEIESGEVHCYIFSGYVRGNWENEFPLYIETTAYAHGFGEVPICVKVEPANKSEFGDMWKDIFETDIDPEDTDFDAQVEAWRSDLRDNYGAH